MSSVDERGGEMYLSKGEKNKSIQSVKDYFIEHRIALRNELSLATNLSPATITTILKELQDINFIKRVGDIQSTGGRKAKCYKLCGNYTSFGLLLLQVDYKQIILNFRVNDLNGVLLTQQYYYFPKATVVEICDCIKEMQDKHHFSYLSISVPSIVSNGILTKCDIDGLEGVNLKVYIEEQLDITTSIENDTHVALLGYLHKQAIQGSSIAFIYQPDRYYSGCSLYINNNIVQGHSNFAGELEYLPDTNTKDYVTILRNQITSIIAIINPSHMIVYAPNVTKEEIIKDLTIPLAHLPAFIFIDTMEELIFKGLSELCIKNTRFKIHQGEIK